MAADADAPPDDPEATGPGFSLARLLDVRDRTRRAVDAIAGRIEVGMTEEEARAEARAVLSGLGLRRGWHKVVVRVGRNTARQYREPSEPGVVLGPRDLFFVDIGPIHDGIEGDAGDTFVVGDDPDHLRAAADVRALWTETRDHWARGGVTGRELYRFAEEAAAARGWRLNLDLTGHRLSEFPHAAHYDGTVADVPRPLAPARWVLEMSVAHPDGTHGAFYEDLLLDDQSYPGGSAPSA